MPQKQTAKRHSGLLPARRQRRGLDPYPLCRMQKRLSVMSDGRHSELETAEQRMPSEWHRCQKGE